MSTTDARGYRRDGRWCCEDQSRLAKLYDCEQIGSATLAMTTGTHKRRRWFQFRLRTLLIAILVLSLPLSWFAWKMEKARRQKEFTERIERLGGSVSCWPTEPSALEWTAWRTVGRVQPDKLRAQDSANYSSSPTCAAPLGPAIRSTPDSPSALARSPQT